MAITIAGTVMPNSLAQRGKYTFHPQQERPNGAGVLYGAGEQWAEWSWPYLEQSDWDWLIARYTAAKSTTTFTLPDDGHTERSFTGGGMKRPTYKEFSAGLYLDVTVEWRWLMPLVS